MPKKWVNKKLDFYTLTTCQFEESVILGISIIEQKSLPIRLIGYYSQFRCHTTLLL